MTRILAICLAVLLAGSALAGMRDVRFASIDGGELAFSAWAGQPVLVVNTASQCAFTSQYEELQTLHERYADAGLVVLAVPSDDFRQELDSAEEVKEFCEMAFGLTLPMADITRVTGAEAHPFYKQVRAETGFEPRWNFNKVLIGRDGRVKATWHSTTKPLSPTVTRAVEAALAE